jgi:hypothetical protein
MSTTCSGNIKGRGNLGDTCDSEGGIRVDLREVRCDDVFVWSRIEADSCEHGDDPSGLMNCA